MHKNLFPLGFEPQTTGCEGEIPVHYTDNLVLL